jgi:hypothetical protein
VTYIPCHESRFLACECGQRRERLRAVTSTYESPRILFFFDQLFINPGFTRGHPRAMNLVWSETLKSGVKKKRA